MATFAKSTFNASIYSASRPTYPTQLFDYIFNHHRRKPNAGWKRAVDLGCGTGQATIQLHPFNEVIGLDPSENMVKAAVANSAFFPTSSTGASLGGNHKFQFRRGNAEDLSSAGIENESVDLVIAAQACHWFDWSKVWPEMERILRVGGTAAFWIYSEFRLPEYLSVTPIITAYAQGGDPLTSLGPHFERPGRTILENHLLDVPSPDRVQQTTRLSNEERVYFAGDYHTKTLPASQTLPVIMQKEMRWRDLLGYFRTWSSLYKYHELYPGDKVRAHDGRFLEDLETASTLTNEGAEEKDIDVGGGDIAVRFWKDLRSAALEEKAGEARVGVNETLVVEWPLALILVSKV
ncbi:S-adenosyl-L-methionine-dependent methyltransferase [Macrolepiota fuliginosa MF-IS2]|uniref:S-adenosyl-L-methionine-dependent methyltransferase n=1 Tax=Macrolepiota fuliginosa MF-IS2 TaxID=1400762 RepID=A0A9P5XF50_9AGAR|nr:S-adenosyl-L-methionine-dependent methyltransferase [Macrolepiota fuliginosa MF-IS2]